jgi:PAS domain S-box-containing protein
MKNNLPAWVILLLIRRKLCYKTAYHKPDQAPPPPLKDTTMFFGYLLTALAAGGGGIGTGPGQAVVHIMSLALICGLFGFLTLKSHRQKKVEECLRESEARFRELADLLPQTVIETDAEGNLTFASRQAFATFGYTPDDLDRGINALSIIIPEERERARTNIRRVLDGETRMGDEFTVIRKDGGTFPVLLYVNSVQRQGRSAGIRGIVIDMTERNQVKDHLRKLSTVVEQSPVSIIITDPAGIIEYINPRFTALTGYSREEAAGRNPGFMKSGETPREEYCLLWETIGNGREWQGEFRNRKKNGELIWEWVVIAPVKDSNGTIIHYVGIKEDITGGKKAAEEKAHLESQLLQAHKMEAVGQLAGGVAHDFNNILTAIIGFGNLLKMSMTGTESDRHYLNQILSAADRASQLTQGLLAFSRKQIINPQACDLNSLVTDMAKLLTRLIGDDIDLSCSIHEHDLTVMADAGQIHQVMMNLAANARDSMPGGGSLSISTGRVELTVGKSGGERYGSSPPGDYAMLAFTDTGAGMDEATRKRIFEPFFTTKTMGKGTGLGLAIVHGIIHQHGGCIEIESSPGGGTSFRILLPLLLRGELPGQTPVEDPPVMMSGNETILVVEDNAQVRSLAMTLLGQFGYRAIEARDGEEAVSVFSRHQHEINLVLMDVIMPKMNGKAAYDAIRAITPDIRVLFTSGYTDDAINRKGILLEGINFIYKPAHPQALLRKIRDVLDA